MTGKSLQDARRDYGTINRPTADNEEPVEENRRRLHRELSARQVQMIAIAGTIGTGLFLGK